MKILVANIGSTSFKYRLYAMPDETLLARGGVERIGSEEARTYVHVGNGTDQSIGPVPDHAVAVSACLDRLTAGETGALNTREELSAIGFKAVHAQNVSGVRLVTAEVLAAMDAYAEVAPAHNPPYATAMRQLAEAMPTLPLVAAFETGFHEDAPEAHRLYAIPYEWVERYGIRRYGFHGASHRYVSERMAELTGRTDLRLVSCHLGGSSSLAAIRGGRSLGASMGMSPQSGTPQGYRVGDFDPFALTVLVRDGGMALEEALEALANRSGLAGLSGIGPDLRDIEEAANAGSHRARLAIDVYVASLRDYLGSFIVRLGGVDAIAFAGGIGENSPGIRKAMTEGLEDLGIHLDDELNSTARGESKISRQGVDIRVVPTNEEIIVARQTFGLLSRSGDR